jgi:hypothetical protein
MVQREAVKQGSGRGRGTRQRRAQLRRLSGASAAGRRRVCKRVDERWSDLSVAPREVFAVGAVGGAVRCGLRHRAPSGGKNKAGSLRCGLPENWRRETARINGCLCSRRRKGPKAKREGEEAWFVRCCVPRSAQWLTGRGCQLCPPYWGVPLRVLVQTTAQTSHAPTLHRIAIAAQTERGHPCHRHRCAQPTDKGRRAVTVTVGPTDSSRACDACHCNHAGS